MKGQIKKSRHNGYRSWLKSQSCSFSTCKSAIEEDKVSCTISQEDSKDWEIHNLKSQLDQLQSSFNEESCEMKLKFKAKEDQLRSANDYLETLSSEREFDRAEILKLSQDLSQERKWRDTDKSIIDDLKNQVIYFKATQWSMQPMKNDFSKIMHSVSRFGERKLHLCVHLGLATDIEINFIRK